MQDRMISFDKNIAFSLKEKSAANYARV